MYSPEGKECFWCSPGKIVKSDGTGCEDCPTGKYGLVDDPEPNTTTYFSHAMARSEHPNVLVYGGHGTTCASCRVGEEPQRGNVTDHTVTGATRCLACEVLGAGMYSADGLRCVACPDGKYPNADRSGCVQCHAGHYGVNASCERCADGKQPNANQTGCIACPVLS